MKRPEIPKPSRIPACHEFNVQVAMDVFEEKDADGKMMTFLSMI